MTYSTTAILAFLVLCIVNHDALRNRHFRNTTPAGKTYRRLLLSIAAFYIFDALWGVLYDAHLSALLFADTELFFLAMTATIFLWTRYVIHSLQGKDWLTTALHYAGWLFLAFLCFTLILNCFLPVVFFFDENGGYHTTKLRYAILAMQILMFMASVCYVLFSGKSRDPSAKRRHWAIGAYGVAMTVMVILQVLYPMLPMYCIGCLLGTCILHTFVLEELKEDRRLELEEMLRREQEHEQELGSVKQMAYTDPLTGVKSSHAYVEAEKRVDERIANDELKEFGVVVFDVNGLKQINDTQGHDAGDRLIRDGCRLICTQFQHSPVYRIGGDEFVAVLEGEDYRNRKSLLADFENAMEENLRSGDVVIASGLAVFRHGHDNSYRRVFERADMRMYDRKDALKALAD